MGTGIIFNSSGKAFAMNISITANEYRDLLDVLHIADVIMSGHRKDEDKRTERHRSLIQKLYALAPGEGLDRLIRYNELIKKHIPTPEFEKGSLAHAIIDEFGDHIFWDELISRLTARDAAHRAGGIERLNAMTESDRHTLEASVRHRYIEEFSRHGMSNVTVIEQFGHVGTTPTITSD